jgi:hypothetical protein
LVEAFTDISVMGVHNTCDGDACWFTAGEAFLYYPGTDLISRPQISEYPGDPLLPQNAVRTIMWSLPIPLYAVGLGLQWTRKRRKRIKGRMVMRTRDTFAKDCAVLNVEILRKQISVHKEIAALEEGVVNTKVTEETLDQKGLLETLVWMLTGVE